MRINCKIIYDDFGMSEQKITKFMPKTLYNGIVKKCAVIEYPKSEIGIYQAA